MSFLVSLRATIGAKQSLVVIAPSLRSSNDSKEAKSPYLTQSPRPQAHNIWRYMICPTVKY